MDKNVQGVIGRGSTNPFKDELLEAIRKREQYSKKYIIDSFDPPTTIDSLKKYIKDKLNRYCTNLKITVQVRGKLGEKTIAIHALFDADKTSVFSRHILSQNTMAESNTGFEVAVLKLALHNRLKLLGSTVKENEYFVSKGTIGVKLDATKILRSMFGKPNTEFEYRVDPFENITIID